MEAQRRVSKEYFSNDAVFPTQSSKLLGALVAVFKQPPDDLDPSASLAQISLILQTAELERRIMQSALGPLREKVRKTGCRISFRSVLPKHRGHGARDLCSARHHRRLKEKKTKSYADLDCNSMRPPELVSCRIWRLVSTCLRLLGSSIKTSPS